MPQKYGVIMFDRLLKFMFSVSAFIGSHSSFMISASLFTEGSTSTYKLQFRIIIAVGTDIGRNCPSKVCKQALSISV